MMLFSEALLPDTLNESLKTLFAEVGVPNLPSAVAPLYHLWVKEEILVEMPRFDRWGLCPAGQKGERENLLLPMPGSGLEEETEESEDADEEEAESSRARRELFAMPIYSDDEDATANFIVVPSWHTWVEAEEEDAEAHDEPRGVEGSAGARAKVCEAVGSPDKVAAGEGGSGDAGAAQPKSGMKRGRWAASDE
jgi:hypothetical protein